MPSKSETPYGYVAEQSPQMSDDVVQKPTVVALLELIAAGCSVREILDTASNATELRATAGRCVLFVVDLRDRRVAAIATQGLPPSFRTMFDGLGFESAVGPSTIAANQFSATIVADLETDPSWQDAPLRAIAIEHGLCRCWAVPVAGCGILVVFTEQAVLSTPSRESFISSLGLIIGIALEIEQAKAALMQADAEINQLSGLMRVTSAVASEMIEPVSGIVINSCASVRMLSTEPSDTKRVRETLRRTLRDCERITQMIGRIDDITTQATVGSSEAGSSDSRVTQWQRSGSRLRQRDGLQRGAGMRFLRRL